MLLGCMTSGVKLLTHEGGNAWCWKQCNIQFWEAWIEEYGDEEDSSVIKQFKTQHMHLSHDHPLHLSFLNNLPEEARKDCYGRYSKTGCKGEDIETMRYFVCFGCKFILWEKCFLSPVENYIIQPLKNVHRHPLYLWAIQKNYEWNWNITSEVCVKQKQRK